MQAAAKTGLTQPNLDHALQLCGVGKGLLQEAAFLREPSHVLQGLGPFIIENTGLFSVWALVGKHEGLRHCGAYRPAASPELGAALTKSDFSRVAVLAHHTWQRLGCSGWQTQVTALPNGVKMMCWAEQRKAGMWQLRMHLAEQGPKRRRCQPARDRFHNKEIISLEKALSCEASERVQAMCGSPWATQSRDACESQAVRNFRH